MERVRAVRGWAIAAYPAAWLTAAIRRQLPHGAAVQLNEGSTVIGSPARNLHDPLRRSIDVAGRTWTLTVGRPGRAGPGPVFAVVLIGGALTVLVALLLLSYARRERYAAGEVDKALKAGDQAEAAVREAEARFRTAFDEAPIGMAITGLDGRYQRVNRALCEITGYSREQLEATSFQSITHPDDHAGDAESIRAMAAGEIESYRAEKRYFHAKGHAIPVALSVGVVRDAEGRPAHLLSQMQDITERKRFEGQLQHLADHDPLTGMLNRRRFEQELDRELASAERYGTTGAVVALDVDHFNFINDSLGHAAGDELITRVAELLRNRLRKTDVLARLGGDEFAAVLPNIDPERALRVAEELLDVLRSEAGRRDGELMRRVTASIGVTMFGGEQSGLTGEEVLVEADIAMYDAKESGRDRVVVYDTPARDQRMQARLTWAERIRLAIEEDRFVLHAQPIIALTDDERPRHELLLRMIGDGDELIPPGAFLSVAERFDLVQDIDRWVIAHALELLAAVQRQRPDAVLEINLSGRSITDADLPDFVAAEAKRHGADLRGLCIEVTETAAIVNIDRAKRLARRLRELGCSFALDDFGAGFASFYYLKHLEFDYLKIDGEFVQDLPSSRSNQLVVEAVVLIAKGLGKRTVAEFVGDQETLDLLRESGVDYAQGFFLGKPEPRTVEELGHISSITYG